MIVKMVSIMMAMVLLSATAVLGAVVALPQARSAGTLDNSTSVRHGRRVASHHHAYVPVNERGRPCAPSPLWDREVNPANYEFGCREIDVRLP